jgi:hypothetical protein
MYLGLKICKIKKFIKPLMLNSCLMFSKTRSLKSESITYKIHEKKVKSLLLKSNWSRIDDY